MSYIIYVDQEAIRSNQKRGDAEHPPIIIIENGVRHQAHSVEILGPSRLLYDPTKQNIARVWLETKGPVQWDK